jgi:hypothetical protein
MFRPMFRILQNDTISSEVLEALLWGGLSGVPSGSGRLSIGLLDAAEILDGPHKCRGERRLVSVKTVMPRAPGKSQF